MSNPNLDLSKSSLSFIKKVAAEGGKFVRIDGKVFILLDGKRIEISPEFNNHAYAALQIQHCKIGTAEFSGKPLCQRIAVVASQKCSSVRVVKFSGLSKDKKRIYLPIQGGKTLQITSADLQAIENGNNPDFLWVEHPKDDPFNFLPDCNVPTALRLFERLCVNSQSCSEPNSWFVAMHEGLFPFVKDFARARMLVEHLAASQRGKTTGALRFVKMHGLGDVLGDVSPAYFRNNCDELRLVVLDNKEHGDQTRDLIQLLLFAATGAQNGRSMQDGNAREMKDRPVVVITSIEGVYKRELQKRTVYIPYGVRLDNVNRDRDKIEDQISTHRDEIVSGLCHVLKRFLDSQETMEDYTPVSISGSFSEFSGYISQLARLLHCYASETGRSRAWAEAIITIWCDTLGNVAEEEGDELENHVFSLLSLYDAVFEKNIAGEISPQQRALLSCFKRVDNYENAGDRGTMFVTTAGKLLNAMALNKIGADSIPKTAQAMGRRLEEPKWVRLRVLKRIDDPCLKRQSQERPVGIFRPNEQGTGDSFESFNSGLLSALPFGLAATPLTP